MLIDIQTPIDLGIDDSIHLDYKAAGALANKTGKERNYE